ncbi:hypothetical protein GQ55_4G331700 [Panicum hallii var. hallii]|uniref:Uncharacterized protein n=1 Tax=Panicum hallii var. hallii TaxID=1504633 RepID=A0A2T7E2P8_9POAL|nr:hypothetical protein GQ55_4G331700 [Panicum hallii var. hallii]
MFTQPGPRPRTSPPAMALRLPFQKTSLSDCCSVKSGPQLSDRTALGDPRPGPSTLNMGTQLLGLPERRRVPSAARRMGARHAHLIRGEIPVLRSATATSTKATRDGRRKVSELSAISVRIGCR